MAYRRKSLRKYQIATTTSAISETVKENDPFDIPWICFKFGSVPDGTDRIKVYVRSQYGAAYDVLAVNYDPNGKTDIVLPCIASISPADTVEISYANTNGYSVSGWAVTEL